MSGRGELHRLVDSLPEADVHAARRFLEFLLSTNDEPFLRALREAPEDDEPASPDEDETAQQEWEAYQRGEVRAWEEIRTELARD